MLRGSYAGGSLAVTARRPCRRPGPSATLHARVQAPGARLLGVHVRTVPAELRPRHSRLCYSFALRRFSLPLHGRAQQSLRISSRLLASPSPCAALGCFAFPSRTPLCSASPLRCRAGLRRRVISHFKAVARQISEELCLRLATLRYAFAMPCFALPSPRGAPQSQAFAARIDPSPLQAAALLRRSCSLPVMAELPNASAHQSVAGPSRGRSFPCCSFANRFTALLFLRRSRLSRAFPSPRRAKQISSFAALGLAGLLRRGAPPSRRYSGSEPSVHSKRPLPLLRHWPMPRNWP